MKFIILVFALIGCTTAALLDSATQGPNPQDIATPEPEYIDIDESAPEPAPAAIPVQPRSSFFAAPQPQFQQFPVAAPSYTAPSHNYLPPSASASQISGHTFSPQNGYQYRQVRRFIYRRRY